MLTLRYAGTLIGKMHIILPLAPKKIWGFDSSVKKILKGWDVRVPASKMIQNEMKEWEKYENIIPLF